MLQVLSHLILTSILWGKSWHPHHIVQEAKPKLWTPILHWHSFLLVLKLLLGSLQKRGTHNLKHLAPFDDSDLEKALAYLELKTIIFTHALVLHLRKAEQAKMPPSHGSFANTTSRVFLLKCARHLQIQLIVIWLKKPLFVYLFGCSRSWFLLIGFL